MKRYGKILVFLLCALLTPAFMLPAAAAAVPGDNDLFVSPDGDDSAAGTVGAPLRTVSAAKEKLKALKNAGEDYGHVHVWLRGGRYEFADTLYFTADDLPDVTYCAYNGEEVVFSGAHEVKGFEEETVNGIRVFTKVLDTAADPADFKSIFCGDEQMPVPRYPEEGYFTVADTCPEDDLWTEDDTPWSFTRGQRSFYADPADLAEDFTNPGDVQVRILHYWHDELMYLTGVDRQSGKLGLSRPSSMLIRDIDRYYFENVFEALNGPGEWYLNRETRKLYYVPRDGEAADTLVLKTSSLERLIDIDGVSGIGFEGIRFTETDWNVPSPGEWEGDWRSENDVDALQAALDVKGVVTVRHAENVRFKNCEFTNLGADGLKFMNGARHCGADSCLFRNIAATGVFVGGTNGQPDDPETAADITVTNCVVNGYGRKFFCAIGIHITYCDGAEISHNEISDGYYTGISCGWVWGYSYHLTKNVRIADNLIYNIGQGWLSDMGGIYMLGIQPGTVLSGNVIHNVAADPGEGGYGGWGIYLDEGSSRMLVENNLVFCCGSQGLNIHYGEGNIFRNNISALNSEGQVSAGSRGEETHATAFYYDNIFLTDGGAPVYVYMLDPAHFYDNGNLMWDLRKGGALRFSVSDAAGTIGFDAALRRGFLHNPAVADPGFADAGNFDFTLPEDSPAFDLNFKAWDYGSAGTVKDTVVGFGLAGGGTAYNEHATPAEAYGKTGGKVSFASVLLPAAIALGALTAAFWLVVSLLRAPGTALLNLGVSAAGVLLAWFVYRNFVHWTPAAYAVGLAALCGAAAVLPLCGPRKSKRPVQGFIIRLVCIFAVFLGTVLLLNNVLRIGEANVMAVVLTALAVYAAICSARNFAAEKRSRGAEE